MEAKAGIQLLVLLAALWMGFMIYFRRSPVMANRAWFGQTLQHLERIEALLEKIATKLDKDGRE